MVIHRLGKLRHRFGIGLLHDRHVAAGSTLTDLRLRLVATQKCVNDFRDVLVYGEAISILNLDQQIERRGRLALEHGLARAAPARFLI